MVGAQRAELREHALVVGVEGLLPGLAVAAAAVHDEVLLRAEAAVAHIPSDYPDTAAGRLRLAQGRGVYVLHGRRLILRRRQEDHKAPRRDDDDEQDDTEDLEQLFSHAASPFN